MAGNNRQRKRGIKVPQKNKYETHVRPYLEAVKAWCRKGATEESISKKLGVAYSTFRRYKEEHKELTEALMTSKALADSEIENALFRKAKGYNAEIKKTFKCKEEYYDDKGRKCTREVLRTSTDEVHVAADTQAISFYLKNRVPDDWKDKQSIEGSMEFSHKLEDLI